jgi:fatty acid desaturase
LGFLGHDFAHQQAFRSRRWNTTFGTATGAGLVGMSFRWWLTKHNHHHAHPNRDGRDPDLDIPLLVLSPHRPDTRSATWINRLFRDRQPVAFAALAPFAGVGMTVRGLAFLAVRRPKGWVWEAALLTGHTGGLIWLAVATPYGWVAVAAWKLLLGVYLSLSFATNHKGMPVLGRDQKCGVMTRQLRTTRNLRPHWLTDFLVGPLGAQIEHHLFPQIPRSRLRAAGSVVSAFCRYHGLPYHQTGFVAAIREVLAAMAEYGRGTRPAEPPAAH